MVIVLLSLAGIIIESLGSTPVLRINPTVARSLRVLRIIRGVLIIDNVSLDLEVVYFKRGVQIKDVTFLYFTCLLETKEGEIELFFP